MVKKLKVGNQISNSTYLKLILFHVGVAFLLFFFKFLAIPFSVLVLIIGFIFIKKNKNANNEALLVAAYIVGLEVFFRMTDAFLLYETGKYAVIFFLFMGIFYKGISQNTIIYWVYILLLIPGVFIGILTLSADADIRKTILFNISGPLCLGISAIYCFKRQVSFNFMHKLILAIGLPTISTVTFIFLYAPNVRQLAISTGSNNELSGGFGSNQVATILGLGIFCFFSMLLFQSKQKLQLIINILIVSLLAFRGAVTFSRGGMITSLAMILILVFVIFLLVKTKVKIKIFNFSIIAIILFSFVWSFISIQTNGLIDKRYANKDLNGRDKASQFTGREIIFTGEFNYFLENPVFGIGVGKSKENRLEETGENVASHSEISRLLSEHGSFGLIGLLILILTPLFLYSSNKQHIYLLPFYIFWIFTINHAAMRLAAPAFIYGLTLLKVRFENNEIMQNNDN